MTKPYRAQRRALLAAASAATVAGLWGMRTASAATMEEIQQRGVMRVVTEDDYYPFEFVTDGKPDGFNKDAVEELRRWAAPLKIEQQILPWTGLLAAVSADRYDAAITGAGVTDDRLGAFNYAPPIAADITYWIKRANDDNIQSLKDLSGKRIGLQAGGAQLARIPELEARLRAVGGTLGRVVEYQAYPEVYADLANRRLDVALNSLVPASLLVRERPKVFALGEAVATPGFIAWPVAKHNPSVLAYLTAFVRHLHDSGKMAQMQQKWLGITFPNLPREPITSVAQYHRLRTA